ncbi:phosphorylase [uncultured Enterovirga sp.]|uniref:phosphorylase family protein n=1 Tax=uncultured Enterovirga sp. TaxID=2026352 RepID=UPI0035CC196F
MTTILVVCGLGHEARIAAGSNIVTVAGGGVRAILERRLQAVPREGIDAVISFGLAGALDPLLRVGDILVPDHVLSLDGESWPTTPELRERWTGFGIGEPDRPASMPRSSSEAPLRGAPQDEEGGEIDPRPRPEVRVEREPRITPSGSIALLGVDAPVLGTADKARLRADTGAAAVDMESHIAARYAAAHDLPFAALRAVSDGADHSLPPVAGAAMRPDGSVDVLGVIRGLARDPGQLAALLATARDAGRAFRALRRVRGFLGPGFGLQL